MNTIEKKIYFVTDAHLGVPDYESSLEREKLLVQWLDSVSSDIAELYLLGDIFDFWFEYKSVVPRGYARLLGKLAQLSDMGVAIHYFTGNHDMWTFGYFEQEIRLKLYREPVEREINGKRFYIGHGDGLGPGDYGYKFIKSVFSNRLSQWLFARLHPNFAFWLANYFSKKSRFSNHTADKAAGNPEQERLVRYAKSLLAQKHYDFFVFGHRHQSLDLPIGNNSRFINVGEWMNKFNYAVFDGEDITIKQFFPHTEKMQ